LQNSHSDRPARHTSGQTEREHAAEVTFAISSFPDFTCAFVIACLRSQVFPVAFYNSPKISFCVVLTDSMKRYVFAVSAGRCKVDTTAWLTVASFVKLNRYCPYPTSYR
jgi:hypothetical protein